MSPAQDYTIVVPTIGRPSLAVLLTSLAAQEVHGAHVMPQEVVVVDDRPAAPGAPGVDLGQSGAWLPVRIVRTGGRGPAAARNAGWRCARTPWVVFLDDDVQLPPSWAPDLLADLRSAAPRVGGVQGRIVVPLPPGRRPTDWERSTAGLESARWATADMAYRRVTLEQVSGFDERFPRAYREDADLAARVRRAGWTLAQGERHVLHPVRPAADDVSLRVQAGTFDDATLRALHGRRWRTVAQTGRGRLRLHLATVAVAALTVAAALTRRPRLTAVAAWVWAAFTADFFVRRLTPGPRPADEVFAREARRLAWTSVAIPFAAVAHRARGEWNARGGLPPWPLPIDAVLFDRDGTLIEDIPYNGDPEAVRPTEGARAVLDALRSRGVLVGVVTNQSGLCRGLLTAAQVQSVNAEVEARLGPFDTWQVCPHCPEDECLCRKPRPGMILAAAQELGLAPAACAVVGDIGADVEAARAAGAVGVLVPAPATRTEEVAEAELVAADLAGAIDLLAARLGAASPELGRAAWR
ncbi:HAD-IIIA family hydrolase [Sanguibacter suarezii]|uniref:HAD-IIIA family hydrolase n=1 Tax=Sanguibacter suarezii TaxID=60921 RepID=UPI00082F2F97